MSARSASETIVAVVAERWYLAVAALILALLGAFAAFYNAVDGDLSKQPVDNRIEIWFLEDDPALASFRDFQETFGNDEVVLVLLRDERDARGVFTPETLTLVADISSRIKALEHVDGVTSLSTVLYTGPQEEDREVLAVEKMFKRVENAAQAKRVQTRVLSDPLLRRDLVSEDLRSTMLSIRMARNIDQVRAPALAAIERELEQASVAAGREKRDWYWAGIGVSNEELNRITQTDAPFFTNLSTLVIGICLWIALRRFIPVLAALLGVVLAVALMWGIYLGLGQKVNLITMVLPTLVMVIGLTDSVYYLTSYYQDRKKLAAQGLTRREILVKSLGFCLLPGLFNSITASVAFLAFLSAKMAVIRQLGLFAGVGIMVAFVTSALCCIIACAVFDVRPPGMPKEGDEAEPTPDPALAAGPVEDGRVVRAMDWLGELVVAHPRRILLAAVAVFGLSLVGVSQLQVDSDPINYFYDDHPHKLEIREFERTFGPAQPLEFVVDTGREDGLKDPVVLKAMDALQERVLKQEPQVRNAVSLVGVVKRLHQVYVDPDDQDAYTIPDHVDAVSQLIELFYDPRKNDDPLTLVDFPGFQKGRITFRVPVSSSRQLEGLIQRIEAVGGELLPPGCTIQASGYPPLYVRLIDYLVAAQVQSLAITFVLVFVIIGLLFRSLRYALISVPPNIIPVVMMLGFMGLCGINLDGATVLIAAIALGIAVDDTIHFVFKFRSVYEETGDDVLAVKTTLRTTGVAILTTSVVIAVGFSVVALASLRSMAYFGILCGFTMLAALVGELLVTPAVILTFRPRRATDDSEPVS